MGALLAIVYGSKGDIVDNVRFFLRQQLLLFFMAIGLIFGASLVYAQSSPNEFDMEPPLIEHEVVTESDAAQSQPFMATVVDDEKLRTVTLFHRRAGESDYSPELMNRLSTSSTWVARIETDASDGRDIEYYIEARDESGNRTLRGFTFNPLVRQIVSASNLADSEPRGSAPPANEGAQESAAVTTRSRKKTLYYVLGAVGVAVVAGLALGQDDGGGNSESGCSVEGCEVVFTVEQPN